MSHIVRPVPASDRRAPLHLKPAAPLAERVLLPGDPHRALAIAQAILDSPRMFNHHRGLWGYTGGAPDGRPLSVQATGMGGPSAAIVVEELIDLGARTLVRVGTCGALDPGLALGDLVTVSEAVPADGASAALGASGPVRPAAHLADAIHMAAGGGRYARVVSTDLFYDDRPGLARRWREAGAAAVEMEAAALLAVAARHGARAACLLAVSDLIEADAVEAPTAPGPRLEREALADAGVRLGEAALSALLSAVPQARD